MNRKIYEIFHKNAKSAFRIIDNNNFTYKFILKQVDKYLPHASEVLDIGCGVGTIAFYVGAKKKKVVGIDISKKAIQAADKTAINLKLNKNIKFSVKEFPNQIPKNKFDLILCFEVIEHLSDDKYALIQIKKLLKNKGIVILSTPSSNAPLYKLGLAREFDKRVGHLRRYKVDELVRLAKSSGFDVVSIEKNEGILRNFLFVNSSAGKLVRFIRFFMVDIVTFIDNLLLYIFGESDILIVLRKKI